MIIQIIALYTIILHNIKKIINKKNKQYPVEYCLFYIA